MTGGSLTHIHAHALAYEMQRETAESLLGGMLEQCLSLASARENGTAKRQAESCCEGIAFFLITRTHQRGHRAAISASSERTSGASSWKREELASITSHSHFYRNSCRSD